MMQSKITQHTENQENGVCSQEKKSIESGPRVNQMLELKDKDSNMVVISFLNDAHDEGKDRKFIQRNKNKKILDPKNTISEIKIFPELT